MIIEVYHGSKFLYGKEIYCQAYRYHFKRYKSRTRALQYAKYLLTELINHEDTFLLEAALNDAQMTSIKSPFISTTKDRNTARSFALANSTEGYIYTIVGPEEKFFDFNDVRGKNNLPIHKTFNWMNELGIPIRVRPPFEVVRIEKIIELVEHIEVIYTSGGTKL